MTSLNPEDSLIEPSETTEVQRPPKPSCCKSLWPFLKEQLQQINFVSLSTFIYHKGTDVFMPKWAYVLSIVFFGWTIAVLANQVNIFDSVYSQVSFNVLDIDNYQTFVDARFYRFPLSLYFESTNGPVDFCEEVDMYITMPTAAYASEVQIPIANASLQLKFDCTPSGDHSLFSLSNAS